MSNKTKLFNLTKPAAIVLVLTLVFSLFFTGLGIVILNRNDNYEDSSDNSSKDYENTYTATLGGSIKSFDAKSGNYYYVTITTGSNYGEYKIQMNGAYLVNVTDSYNTSKIYNAYTSLNYDNAYEINLSSYTTYTFKLCATKNYISFLATSN